MVGFQGITDAARLTSDVLHLDLDIFTLVDEGDVHNVTEILTERGYDTVLCDVISSTVFREADFNTVLITSGTNSVRESIDEAVRVAHHMRSVRNENVFFREVISNSGTDTVIFQEDDSLSFTTVDRGGGKALIETLKALLPEVRHGAADTIRRTIGGHSYIIRTLVSESPEGSKVVFYVSQGGGGGTRNAGIAYYTKAEALGEYMKSLYSLAGDVNGVNKSLQDMLESSRPLLITGEYGTGRTAVATQAYTISKLASHPLVEIDCGMLTDHSSYGIDLDRPLSQIERDIVEEVIHKHGDNQSTAARQLGISRTTLWRMMKDQGER